VRTVIDDMDAALDAALLMTFPASDPIAVFIPGSDSASVAASQTSAANTFQPDQSPRKDPAQRVWSRSS